MRTYAIGDIHGCLKALETLLELVEPAPDDRLIFLGDYVDRGPDSRGVLDKLMQLSLAPQNVFLRGNHDQMMLLARYDKDELKYWKAIGGLETLDSYNACDIGDVPADHFSWLETTRYFFQTDTHIFVHASIGPEALHKNNERTLLWKRVHGIEEHPSGKKVVCGHTSQGDGRPLNLGHAVCIDTCCYGGQWLTAMNVETDEIFQANQKGETRTGILQDLGKNEA